MIETIASFDGRVAKVCGPVASGKTESLVQRCVHLLKNGVEPSDIRVVATSGFAVQAFQNRLIAAAGEDVDFELAASQIAVSTALDVCVEVLSSEEAKQATGRNPRLLTKSEYNFLVEDLKTSGINTRRLRSMLNFVFRQWAEYVPTATWRTGEEEVVCDQMTANLVFMGGMLEQECPSIAADYLASLETAQAKRYRYLLVDDYQNLTKAEQTALCLTAGEQLIVAGNPNQTVAQRNPNPHAEGFAKFNTLRRGVEVFTLTGGFGNPQVHEFTNAFCARGDMDSSIVASALEDDSSTNSQVKAIKWNFPEDEFNMLTKYLRIKYNEMGEDAHESKTCVIVPNRRWATFVHRALVKRGFEVSCAGMGEGLRGDPRDLERARSLITYTKLNLLAHPDDMVAWRSWCGYGDYLSNSIAWEALIEYANENGFTPQQAIEEAGKPAAKEPFLRANVIVERWVSGHAFIEKNAKRKGFALLHALGAEELPEYEDIQRAMVGDETAAEVFDMLYAHLTSPTWPINPHIVHLTTANNMSGASYDNVLFFGFIDGFTPTRNVFEVVSTEEDREAALNKERRVFYNAAGKAGENLIFSFFTKSQLELAEKTKMQVTRIRSEEGQRIALVRPSSFLQEAGASCPTTIGGQAFMASTEDHSPLRTE